MSDRLRTWCIGNWSNGDRDSGYGNTPEPTVYIYTPTHEHFLRRRKKCDPCLAELIYSAIEVEKYLNQTYAEIYEDAEKMFAAQVLELISVQEKIYTDIEQPSGYARNELTSIMADIISWRNLFAHDQERREPLFFTDQKMYIVENGTVVDHPIQFYHARDKLFKALGIEPRPRKLNYGLVVNN